MHDIEKSTWHLWSSNIAVWQYLLIGQPPSLALIISRNASILTLSCSVSDSE